MKIPGIEINVDSCAVPWRETGSHGVRWYLIDTAGSAARPGQGAAKDSAVLIEMDPGCGYPRHKHLGVEEVLVLRGGYRDDLGEHRCGDYVRYEEGSAHAPVAIGETSQPISDANPICLLYAIARAGIAVSEA
ncbi:MAG: anti-sigma factor ChrR (cupin superfamily) [Planctomycetota bacterium]|jgi:anti-sigma factor ChrR (cupin superfamily)